MKLSEPIPDKLGRYEIRSRIGAGGMGEVFLARDSQLDRMVALKVLSAEVALDQQRLGRFLQEARAASSLSHPNVAHIYEIGEAEGVRFIAMELVEGIGLDDKIAGRPIEMTLLLDLAIQIADALDEAHAHGIIHRDIKSSNIMINPRGRVKVLDFGLAKVTGPAGTSGPSSDSQMATRVKTSPGIVMGTVHYMSPEQALGREMDHRTDIFSLGVVLYEMATGRLPFQGETVTEIIDKVAHAQPEAMSRFNYNVNPEFEIIVRKALRKNRDERYQSVHDMLIDLKELYREIEIADRLQHTSSPPMSPMSTQSLTAAHPAPSAAVPTLHSSVTREQEGPRQTTSSAEFIVREIQRHRTGVIIFATLLILATAGAIAIIKFGRGNATRPGVNSNPTALNPNMTLTRLTSTGRALHAAISPDGKWVAYVQKEGAKQSLWMLQIATNSNIPIVPPSDLVFYRETFSPDGNYLYYIQSGINDPNGSLYQVPSFGGSSHRILTNVGSPIAFSPDGKQFAFVRNDEAATGEDQLYVANQDGTSERKLAMRRGDKWFGDGGCGWSPDGKLIACTAGSYDGGFHETVVGISVETGEQKDMSAIRFTDSGRISWIADGSGIVTNASDQASRDSQLWFIAYPSGEAKRITNDLGDYSGTSLTSDSKTLVTVQIDWNSNVWIGPAQDPARAKQVTSGKRGGAGNMVWMPDGRLLFIWRPGAEEGISVINSDGTGLKQLTNGSGFDWSLSVSSDGRQIVFVSNRTGFPSLWLMDSDGGNLKQLTQGQEDYDPAFSPDDRWILFTSWRKGKRSMWKIASDGGDPIQLTDQFISGPSISPDGKKIAAFFRDEVANSRWRLWLGRYEDGAQLATFETVTPIPANSLVLDGKTSWSPDGKSICYLALRDGLMNLWSQPIDGGPPKQLTNFTENEVRQWAWSRDSKLLALSRGETIGDIVLFKDIH